jgi:predicted nucleic acid-binding protein
MNARYSDYISIFFVDIVLIAAFMFSLLVLRQGELSVLVKLGVYKNVEDLTDKEIISEYNKLKKQSNKLQNRLKREDNGVSVDRRKIRMVSGATNRSNEPTND